MGMLAVSRALGDHNFKEYVISTPDIRSVELTDEMGFLLLACDGVFDVMSNEEAVQHICNEYKARYAAESKRLGVQTLTPEQQSNMDAQIARDLARSLVETVIAKGTRDNVTAMVALL